MGWQREVVGDRVGWRIRNSGMPLLLVEKSAAASALALEVALATIARVGFVAYCSRERVRYYLLGCCIPGHRGLQVVEELVEPRAVERRRHSDCHPKDSVTSVALFALAQVEHEHLHLYRRYTVVVAVQVRFGMSKEEL